VAQQPSLGAACVDVAIDPDDGGDMRVPVGVGQLVCGIEDGDGATFVAIAALSWLWADPSGVVIAEMSWTCWCRVGWLSLTPTIRAMLAAAAASKCSFGSAARPA